MEQRTHVFYSITIYYVEYLYINIGRVSDCAFFFVSRVLALRLLRARNTFHAVSSPPVVDFVRQIFTI